MPTKKTFTITEAAKELRITRAAVHAAIKKGRLPAHWGETTRTVKALLIDEKDLKAFEVDPAQQTRGKKTS
jgi:excisionase family DNA binding protein